MTQDNSFSKVVSNLNDYTRNSQPKVTFTFSSNLLNTWAKKLEKYFWCLEDIKQRIQFDAFISYVISFHQDINSRRAKTTGCHDCSSCGYKTFVLNVLECMSLRSPKLKVAGGHQFCQKCLPLCPSTISGCAYCFYIESEGKRKINVLEQQDNTNLVKMTQPALYSILVSEEIPTYWEGMIVLSPIS